ncbi:MAG: hypothetical protein WBD31_00710 [Rubripirellula sp.]
MTQIEKTQRTQSIRAAEGYLELAMALDDLWPLDGRLKSLLADRAIASLDRIKRPLGHKPHVLFLKGQACRSAEKHLDAITYFKQSIRIDPENLHVYLAMAWSFKRTHQLEAAIKAMQAAVELDCESAIAHYNLACYCALNSQVDLALMHLTFALDLKPEYRDQIATETDFDLVRENPRFVSLVAAAV